MPGFFARCFGRPFPAVAAGAAVGHLRLSGCSYPLKLGVNIIAANHGGREGLRAQVEQWEAELPQARVHGACVLQNETLPAPAHRHAHTHCLHAVCTLCVQPCSWTRAVLHSTATHVSSSP